MNEDVMIQGESISLDNSSLCNSRLNNSMSIAVNQLNGQSSGQVISLMALYRSSRSSPNLTI